MEKFLSSKTNIASTIGAKTPEIPTKTVKETETPEVIELKSPKKEPDESEPSKKRPGGKTSTIWDHFTRIKGGDPNEPRCFCNYCEKQYACHPKRVDHIKNQCLKCPMRVSNKKQKILSFQKETANLLAVSFSKENCRKSLAKMVVLDELSFRFVEGKGFRQFVQTLQPKFTPPGRKTVASDIIQLYEDEQKKLKVELTKEGQRVCLTTDCWTSLQQINYLCLTA